MRTILDVDQLAALKVHAGDVAREFSFVDPRALSQCDRVLRERGEVWAASVVGRILTKRSRVHPSWPWLFTYEMYMLILADEAEFDAIVSMF